MKLLDSLLDAIVRLEGDALVMHVGEKPYVVTASSSMNAYRGPLAWGQVELSSRVLTFDAVSSMLGQILPADQQQALTEFGAIEHEIPSPVGVADRFTVVAARGGEDVWVELRRRPLEGDRAVPVAPVEQTHAVSAAPAAAIEEAQPAPAPAEEPAAVPHGAEAATETEIQGIEIVQEPADVEQPAAHVELESTSSIVVAIPGQDAQEIALNAVPDNAIQIVDDEPQDVPTEEEVDAMLAATAGVILTTGLGEVVEDDATDEGMEIDAQEMRDDAGDEEEIVLEVEMAESVVVMVPLESPRPEQAAGVEEATAAPEVAQEGVTASEQSAELQGPVASAGSAEATFELSPPPLDMAVTEPESEVVIEPPPGTPLFSPEAELAAVAGVAPGFDQDQTGVRPGSDESPTPAAPPQEPSVELASEGASVAAAAESSPEFASAPAVEDVAASSHAVDTAVPSSPVDAAPAAPAAAALAATEPPADVPTLDQSTADVVPMEPQTPAWEPSQAEAWAPQLPTQVESVPELTVPAETPAVLDAAPSAESSAIAAEPPAFAEPPTQAEPAAFVEPSPPAETPPSYVPTDDVIEPTPQVEPPTYVEATSQTEAPVWTESPMNAVEPQAPLEPAIPVDHATEMASTEPPVPPVIEVTAAAEVGETLAVEEPAAMPASGEDQTPITQSTEPALLEPTPPIEAPSVPEMTMEVTPELRQQESPVGHTSHMGGEGAASLDAPAHPVHDPGVPADAPEAGATQHDHETRHGVVVPLGRTTIKPEVVTGPFTPSEDAALMHTLRVAAARGASTVYVVAQSKPMIRIDGEIGPLDNEPTLSAADVDRLVLELAPPRRRDALQNGPVEWLCDVPDVGRVRCLTFRDHRGPGVLFRMMPPRAISVDQLGLTPEVQALCQQSDGLVLVAGARSSGKSTLLNSFIDVINRTRSDHLITVESQIGFVHESRRSFISQRETRGDADLAATFVRAALREDPDVIVIEDLRSAELVAAALEAADSGRLVLASIGAASTIGALERLIELVPADRRARARSTLATSLRGVIAQVLLRRNTGGRVAAREILLNTPAVAQIVLEGKMFQLPVALDSGRRHGMVPLTDSLAAHVRAGSVDVAEAYRKALDRAALVAVLKREGVDTSFAERLA